MTLPREVDGVPRRIRLDHATPMEQAIRTARAAVEAGPADVRLTRAVVLLGEALDVVADFHEDVPVRESARDAALRRAEETQELWHEERRTMTELHQLQLKTAWDSSAKERDRSDAAHATMRRLEDWTHAMGASLKPPGADTYGEGMRDAKAQVAEMLRALAAELGGE